MIKLSIKNFKCFKEQFININKLTILAGANGYGKSSVIQSLLFMRRTIEHCAKWDNETYTPDIDPGLNVELNGAYCLSLGMSNDIIPSDADFCSSMELYLEEDNEYCKISYPLDDEKAFLWLSPDNVYHSKKCTSLPIFKKEFYYLNAERLGPRVSQYVKFQDYPNVGWQGEYCAQILSELNSVRAFSVDKDKLIDPKDVNTSVLKQTQKWIDYVMPGVVINSRIDSQFQSAQVLVENEFSKGNPVIATNIGFGISYVLPIIITGLVAKKGSIMIVENPEAHLHPSAQSKIGHFLSIIAQSGVNVIVETHSDHVVNGIQIAVAKELVNKGIVSINFLSRGDNPQPLVEEISISSNGDLSSWPAGFFDQTQIDFATLFKLRRNG